MYEQILLAPAGSTGNNTHNSVHIEGYDALSVEFVVEAIGATPTVTWKVQASPDDVSVSDANAHWYDLGYVTDASDTISVATQVSTTVGAKIIFLSNPAARKYRRFRVVTSANTNVTYRVEANRIA
jgi:hypothetical protein